MLKSDPKKHAALARRQKVAEAKGPKPSVEPVRCDDVLDPEQALASAESKGAAREKWVAQMQERTDPRFIRKAAQDRQAQQRLDDKEKLKAERERHEKRWHDHEARRLATQQARTADPTNGKPRHRWGSVELPIARPGAPPEDANSQEAHRLATQQARKTEPTNGKLRQCWGSVQLPLARPIAPPEDVNLQEVRQNSSHDVSAPNPSPTPVTRASKPVVGVAELRRQPRTSMANSATKKSGGVSKRPHGKPSAEEVAAASGEKLRAARLVHSGNLASKEAPETTGTEEVKEAEVANDEATGDSRETVVPEIEAREVDAARTAMQWLSSQGLEAYAERLFDNGYDELSIFLQLRAPELEEMLEMASVKAGHRVKFRRAVEALQARRPAQPS